MTSFYPFYKSEWRRLRLLIAGVGAFWAGACAQNKEQSDQFKVVSLAELERAPGHGYVWLHHKPGAPLPGARYEAGFDTQAGFGLNVCRARVDGSVRVGKIFGPDCKLPVGDKELTVQDFDTLVARPGGFWHMSPKTGIDPSKALLAGNEADGKPLYACVARHVSGFWVFSSYRGYQPGTYSGQSCSFGWDGAALTSNDFYVLGTGKPAARAAAAGTATDPKCLKSEVTCSCTTVVGCSQPGLCLCNP